MVVLLGHHLVVLMVQRLVGVMVILLAVCSVVRTVELMDVSMVG